MFFRNVLLAVGTVFVLAGAGLMIAWFGQARNPPAVFETRIENQVAGRAMPNGTLLFKENVTWKDVGSGEIRPGILLRGQETDFLGTYRRDFAEGD
jgi:pilus assembly protein CpaB